MCGRKLEPPVIVIVFRRNIQVNVCCASMASHPEGSGLAPHSCRHGNLKIYNIGIIKFVIN